MATEKRIEKRKLIQQYIGEGLFPLGFTYEGRQGDHWTFERKVEKVRQMIYLYEYRFDKNMISFNLDTNAGNGLVQATQIEGIEFNSYMPGFWTYQDKSKIYMLYRKRLHIFVMYRFQVTLNYRQELQIRLMLGEKVEDSSLIQWENVYQNHHL